MKQILFVQGAGDGAYTADAKPAANLRETLGSDYHVRYPRMPNEADPYHKAWNQSITE